MRPPIKYRPLSLAFCLLGGALLCLALTATPCPAGGEVFVLMRVVPYGGGFTPEQARTAAEATAWLAGLERAAGVLAASAPVRPAGLDVLQLQALAAGLGLVEVEAEAPAAAEGKAVAVARVADVDVGRVSRLLSNENGREYYEDVIAALGQVIPELMRRAKSSRSPLVVPEDASAAPPAESPVERLDRLSDEVEAYMLYRQWLERERLESDRPDFSGRASEAGGADEAVRERRALVDKALALAPDALPLRLAQAELLLREDRFRAAAQLLENLPSAPESTDSEDAAARARNRAGRRLLARALEARALAQLRSDRPALAERDLDVALTLTPDRASLWLGRGAARQMRERFELMCDDYRQACVRGLCRGLAAARERGRCLEDEKEN